jgi:hypothetical protein
MNKNREEKQIDNNPKNPKIDSYKNKESFA